MVSVFNLTDHLSNYLVGLRGIFVSISKNEDKYWINKEIYFFYRPDGLDFVLSGMNFDIPDKEDMNQSNLNIRIMLVKSTLYRKRDIHDYRQWL